MLASPCVALRLDRSGVRSPQRSGKSGLSSRDNLSDVAVRLYGESMIGPFERGHWAGNAAQRSFGAMVAGGRYVVVVPFTDFDGDVHPIGEAWTFLGATFLPHDDGQTLFVTLDGEREWHIRLQWRAETQAEILDHFDTYVQSQDGN